MARTVTQSFTDFKTRLEITANQASNVSTRHTNLRSKLRDKFTVLDDFLTGSYMRSTMIAPLKAADVDVFVVLDSTYYEAAPNGPANVLAKVKRVIDNAYSEATSASRNRHAITISFSDFTVDVVPAFNRQGGGFLIPDPVGKAWLSTNPKTHVDLWIKANSSHDGMFVPFIKMIKAWNRANSRRFQSFHLETMVRQVFTYTKITSYPEAALYFFENAYNNIYVSDPAGLGGSLAGYLSGEYAELVAISTSLTSAATRAREAIAFNKAGENEKAIAKWGVIFGDYFPTYG